MRSIQGRLSLGLSAVLVVVGLGVAQLSLWLFEGGLQRYLEIGLRTESESLLMALVRGDNGLQLDERRLLPAYQRPFSGHYFRIDAHDGAGAGLHWRSRSLWDLQLPWPDAPGLHSDLTLGPEGQALLTLRADYRRLGEDLSISVARDYTPVRASFQRLQVLGLAIAAAALLLILALQRITVKRSLRPLERVREQIAQLQQGRRSALDTQVPEELAPLVGQINHLLAHTEDSLKRSRRAMGNLGHALKTPLAVLLSLAESPRLADQPQVRATLQEQLQQIQQRLDRELNRARLAGDALPGAPFDCAIEWPNLQASLRSVHGDHLQLRCQHPPGARLPWDREDLLELLGNLLDNACKWADAEVSLTLDETDQGWTVQVDDDGPGIAPARRAQVLGRGVRLDEQMAGHGLGLAIVRDIVDSWHGQLALGDSPLGGLQVRIHLPRTST
ncbi:sensor histidine kinase [Pseudomonas sp. HR96]|uniref:sensor histidine kinase n=1 Tax=Pseudomonas sp. HR96 TaxID=1027966 RepID=UPI002A750AF7|nr:sensor histidine kinase [Pseudomonas sp. HR96]WPP02208.1 sensor histidine kinase [Pseudomonas sp. HR96]